METIYRQIRMGLLTPTQQKDKVQKDSEYEIAVQNLSASFYQKKRTVGVSLQEEADYKTQKAQLWDTYYSWAISQGLYEQVTPQKQLEEVEARLARQLEDTNVIRTELGMKEVELKEKVITVIR